MTDSHTNDYKANVFTTIPALFRVKVKTMMYHHDKRIVDYYTLTIGSEKNSCINLTIPVRETHKPIFMDHIDASKPDAPCTIDGVVIKGEKTKQMFYFARTFLKTLTDKTIIEFTDNSQFPCTITETEIRRIPLNVAYLMFYGKTWYDMTFNAELVDEVEQNKYKRLQERRKDPAFKPATFNFKTSILNEILTPLYNKTNTWEEFFNVINEEYKEKKCKMVYMWLADAVKTLTVNGNDIFGFQLWKIDIHNMPLIYYTERKVYMGGGKRKQTRRKKIGLEHPIRDMIPRSEDYEIFSRMPL
jgi:hypothetical protein